MERIIPSAFGITLLASPRWSKTERDHWASQGVSHKTHVFIAVTHDQRNDTVHWWGLDSVVMRYASATHETLPNADANRNTFHCFPRSELSALFKDFRDMGLEDRLRLAYLPNADGTYPQ